MSEGTKYANKNGLQLTRHLNWYCLLDGIGISGNLPLREGIVCSWERKVGRVGGRD